jgi:hypothetical protein
MGFSIPGRQTYSIGAFLFQAGRQIAQGLFYSRPGRQITQGLFYSRQAYI